MTSAAATIPIVAVRSGSPAVLRRTFHATWNSAESRTMAMTTGSTLGRYRDVDPAVRPRCGRPRTGRSDGVEVCLGLEVATPEAIHPQGYATDGQDDRRDDADRVPVAEHRETIVRRQRELL